MKDPEILAMLKDIVSEIDYDIYKELFVYGLDDVEDEESSDSAQTIENLMDIVRSYVQTEEDNL